MSVKDTEEEDQACQPKEKVKWVQGETQIQWMWTGEEEGTEHAMYVGSGAIWPKTAGKDIRGG